ncbi:hypothetical protein, partial [Paenibacillus xylanexedens]|uniref:hypothetical protein n=1 Tax=Paenibacillus xylanexedens TaxID=528191 RepID=UPI003D005101
VMNIGKPYEGKPHVRFDEEGLGAHQSFTLVCYPRIFPWEKGIKKNLGITAIGGLFVIEVYV